MLESMAARRRRRALARCRRAALFSDHRPCLVSKPLYRGTFDYARGTFEAILTRAAGATRVRFRSSGLHSLLFEIESWGLDFCRLNFSKLDCVTSRFFDVSIFVKIRVRERERGRNCRNVYKVHRGKLVIDLTSRAGDKTRARSALRTGTSLASDYTDRDACE